MKLSLITVVYNRVATIERAVQSVLQQHYPDVEYIVVDGASTDGTLAVLECYRHRLAQLVSEPDAGMYDALNKGIALATGDVVGILHADDAFAHPQVLSRVASYLQQHPSVDCLYGDVGFVRHENPDKIVRYFSSANFRKSLFRFGFMPAHTSFFCYRRYFEQYGGYRTDLQIAADFDLLFRFLEKHRLQAAYLPEMLVKMNMGGRSTNGLTSTLTINREIRRILRAHNVPSSYLHLYARYFIKVQEYWRKRVQVGG